MPKLSQEDQKRLLNEADRDYPRTLARLKAVLGKISHTTVERVRADRERLAQDIREDVAELVVLACEEQDAVTARQFREAIAIVGKVTEKVVLSMADAIGSQAMKDLGKGKAP